MTRRQQQDEHRKPNVVKDAIGNDNKRKRQQKTSDNENNKRRVKTKIDETKIAGQRDNHAIPNTTVAAEGSVTKED